MTSQEAGLQWPKKFISGEELVDLGILLCQIELENYFRNRSADLPLGEFCCFLNEFGSLDNLMLNSATFACESCIE